MLATLGTGFLYQEEPSENFIFQSCAQFGSTMWFPEELENTPFLNVVKRFLNKQMDQA